MDERERLAVLEEAVRQIHARLDRQMSDLRNTLVEAREEIKESRDECASGITRLREHVSNGFKEQRESARGWIVGAVVMVTGVAGVAVTVIALVVK